MALPPLWNFSENSSVLEGVGFPYSSNAEAPCLTWMQRQLYSDHDLTICAMQETSLTLAMQEKMQGRMVNVEVSRTKHLKCDKW